MDRDARIDSIKFFLIFCVALGHCFGEFWDKPYVLPTYNFIYLFHMPLFIFLSGYFTKKRSLHSRDFWISELKLLETFIVFNFIHKIPTFFTEPIELQDLIVPSWSLWYLLSLICWRFLIQIMASTFKNRKVLITVAFLLGALIGFSTLSGALSIQRTFCFFPFFVAGYCVAQNNFIEKIRSVNHIFAIAICAVTVIACFGFLNFDIHHVIWGLHPYEEFDVAVGYAFSLRLAFYVVALSLCFSIINLFSFKSPFMAKEGRNTLVYYMYHTLLLLLFFDLAERFDIPVNIGVLVLITLLIMAIIFAMCRIKVFLWLLNPVSSILARHKKNG